LTALCQAKWRNKERAQISRKYHRNIAVCRTINVDWYEWDWSVGYVWYSRR